MGKLKAGAAKACITPLPETLPAQFFMPIEFEGVYRDLYVRVLVLDNGEEKTAMITYDAADMSRTEDMSRALMEAYGFKKENLCYAATHSHEAPSFDNTHEGIKHDPVRLKWVMGYGDYIIAQTVKAAGEALKKLKPAKYCFLTGESCVNVCRDELFEDGHWGQGMDFTGPSDKTLAVLQVQDLEGNVIAGLINYCVHGTCCYQGRDKENEKFLIAGDLPGMVSIYLEERYKEDGAVFLWTSGAAGNQNPIFFCQYLKYNHDKTHTSCPVGYQAWNLCEALAQRHAVDAIRVMEQMTGFKEEIGRICTMEETVVLPGQRLVRADGTSGMIIPGDSSVELTIEDGEPQELRLKLMIIDDIAFLSMNAELVTEIGLRLKEQVPYKKFVIVTHAGERIGYLPDKSGYDRRTFAFYASKVKDGVAEERMTPVILNMCKKTMSREGE